ncbi:MAG: hypothetical protein ACW99J_20930 [Candidatus Thorarchaeota archaeon]|jgi:hypothetical protein
MKEDVYAMIYQDVDCQYYLSRGNGYKYGPFLTPGQAWRWLRRYLPHWK